MLETPNRDVLEAIHRLSGSGDFRRLREWMARQEAMVTRRLVDAEGDPGPDRGAARVLGELARLFAAASNLPAGAPAPRTGRQF